MSQQKRRNIIFLICSLLIFITTIGWAKSEVKNNIYHIHTDVLELNHFYDEHGCVAFDQYILWETPFNGKPDLVRAWMLIKDGREVLTEKELKAQKEKLQEELKKEWNLKEWPSELRVPFSPRWIGSKKIRREGKTISFIENDKLIVVHFDSFKETWTQYDPELANRKILPKEKRVQLW